MPASVDIAPTILRHLGIEVPEAIRREMDGIPFLGQLSIANMRVERNKDEIEIRWESLDTEGEVVVEISTTNNFRTGGTDEYTTAGTAKVSDGKYKIDLKNESSTFYKVLLKAPYNWTNRWVVAD